MKKYIVTLGAIFYWLLFMIVQLYGWITAKFIFPICWLFWDWIHKKDNILSIFLWYYCDSLEPYGDKWYRRSIGYPIELEQVYKLNWWKKFVLAYRFQAIRNPIWNFNYAFPKWDFKERPQDPNVNIYIDNGTLKKNTYPVDTLKNLPVLKYVDERGNYMNNRGEYLSLKHSILGFVFTVWTYKGLPYFKLGFAGIALGADKEIQIGFNHYRSTFRVKPYFFRRKEWYEDLSN